MGGPREIGDRPGCGGRCPRRLHHRRSPAAWWPEVRAARLRGDRPQLFP